MGDNRSQSRDSRIFGFVHRRQIVGRATTVVLSKVPDELFQLRADRFFLPLH
jgi:signal peptidase I